MSNKLSVTVLVTLLGACSLQTPGQNNISQDSFLTQALKNSKAPQPMPSVKPQEERGITSLPPVADFVANKKISDNVEPKIFFDDVVPVIEKDKAVLGSVTVIYENIQEFRADNKSGRIYSKNPSSLDLVNKVLNRYKLESVGDYAYPGISEEQMNRDVELVQQKYGVQSPHRKSIHSYQFSKDSDTKIIAEELRKLPFVRTAYMTPKIEWSANLTELSSHSIGDSISPSNNDTGFSTPEHLDWWWFNKIKAFHGLNYFDATTSSMPIIAVIDSGFDNRSTTEDKPNYLSGLAIKYDPNASPQWTLHQDIFQYQSDDPRETKSHGSLVASIAASPRNNNRGLMGIAPGAAIRPYKMMTTCNFVCSDPYSWSVRPETVAHGIFQASYSDADVINISMDVDDAPITADPAINNEIIAASSRGKSVVIAAGNIDVNVDFRNTVPGPQNNFALPSCGDCIIVGGTEQDSYYHPSHWKDGAITGSNYGNRVDITAGAKDIVGTSYNIPATYNNDTLIKDSGTSFATPMVAATVGMMKKIAQNQGHNLTTFQLKNLVVHASTLRRFKPSSDPYSTEDPDFIMGLNLGSNANSITNNFTYMSGIRDLNVYNAMVIAKNINSYSALTRAYNTDDFIWVAENGNWSSTYENSFGQDKIYGVSDLSSGNTLNFATRNSGGSYAFGYQVYRPSANVFDQMGGVAYLTGVNNNSSYPTGWHQVKSYYY